MQSQYSLKKTPDYSMFRFSSIALGCLLIFSAYRIALQEINEVLDAQMQNLAERVAQHDPEPVQSQFDQAKHYHEERPGLSMSGLMQMQNIKLMP